MDNRAHLTTEHRNENSMRIDCLSVDECFDVINAEDAAIADAVAAAKPQICAAIGLVVKALESGGRLIYVGAGTSGRLGVLDATECPPTFLTDPQVVQGVIAGGAEALTRSIEGAEDDPVAATKALSDRDLGPRDIVFGIATGGTTPFVHAAIEFAKQRGAKTIFLACVPGNQVSDRADVSIRVITGPEVVTGSTRMKAGTATKMVLNLVTTIAMIRLGKVFQNLMVDVNTRANAKLVDRGTRIIQAIADIPREQARKLLDAAEGRVKTALVMHFRRMDRASAEQLLKDSGGRLSELIETSRSID